jgi:signal transduction histidine kinase
LRPPVEVIELAVTRMSRLIQDLLDVTRMEAGHLAIDHARVSARQLVTEAVEAQQQLAASVSIELRVEVAPGVSEVWGDRGRLLQAFDNLIGNAIKFTRPSGGIVVGAAPRDGEVLFWVADTGAGISAEDIPHVFDRFWQAQRAERRGAGLGLAIVKGVVEVHGGRIWVESTPGHGSSFLFTIPTAPGAESPSDVSAPDPT